MAAVGLVAGACVTARSEDSATSPLVSPTATTAVVAATPSVQPIDSPEAAPTDAAPSESGAIEMPVTAAPTRGSSPSAMPTPSQPSIGYIALDGSQVYVQAISAGIRDAARAAGIELVECDSGWTRPGARACAGQLAEAGVSGIVSMQPFSDLTEEVCTSTAGVPVVGIVYDQGPCQVSLLQVDQAESGRLAGLALGALAAERWACEVKAYASLESGAGDPIGGARMDGFREGYQEHCQLPRKKYALADAQHLITAQTQMGSVLMKVSGKPVIVAGVSDSAALGALQAAEERDRANHVWVAGQLAEPAARDAIACDKHFVASVAQFPERFGMVAIPALLEAMDGGTVPARLDAEMALVTAQNVRELFPDTVDCDA